jgi:hypothetical protein
MVGDGITSCDVPQYETKFELQQSGTTAAEFDEASFKTMLYDSGVVPGTIDPSNVIVNVAEVGGSGRRRSLLQDSGSDSTGQHDALATQEDRNPADVAVQTDGAAGGANENPDPQAPADAGSPVDKGVNPHGESEPHPVPPARHLLQVTSGIQITVTIYSESAAVMSNVTSSINVSSLEGSGFEVSSPPTSIVNQDATEPTVATSVGFRVTSVQFDDRTSQWLVDIRYTSTSPNTLTSLYISKPGTTLPYPLEAKNSYYVSKHPCIIYNAVCCLNDYKSMYVVGSFRNNISSTIGTCNSTVQEQNSLGMFDPAGNSMMVEGIFDEFPDSSVTRVSANEVRLRIAQTDLSTGGLAMRSPLESNPAGYQLQFFVGMTYFTLLEANAISVSASQTTITLAISNSITFSFSGSQDYSFIKYVTLTVMQNKWMDGLIERRMQFVQMGFVLPVGTRQNMDTGLVPLTSVRFAIARSMPDRTNSSLWTNPCFSGYGKGMFDPVNEYRQLYTAASAQPCASNYNLCMNPLVHVLPTNLVNFYFPIGDRTLTPDILASIDQYNVYVMFQLSVITSTGKAIATNVFARAPLHSDQIMSACESVTAEASLLSTTQVDIGIGFVGTQAAWNSSMVLYRDVTQTSKNANNFLDVASNYTSKAFSMALITLVVKGSSSIFSRQSASSFSIDIEQMSIIHFLDEVRFNTISDLIKTDEAYAVSLNPTTSRPHMTFTESVSQLCNPSTAALSCALYTNIYNRGVSRAGAVHPLATGLGTTSTTATRDWLTQNILRATDEYSVMLASNMTSLVRSNFDIDDRINRAWLVNPGNKWIVPMSNGYQSDLLLSDRLIIVAVITLNDGNGNVLRRRLMSFATPGQRSLVPSGALRSMSIIKESAVEASAVSASHPSSATRGLLQASATSSSAQEYINVPLKVSQTEADDGMVDSALRNIVKQPRSGMFPPIEFDTDVPLTLRQVYGIGDDKKYDVLEITLYARFDELYELPNWLDSIGGEFFRRLQKHLAIICPSCEAIAPAFNNLQRFTIVDSGSVVAAGGTTPGGRRRMLLQQQQGSGGGGGGSLVAGTYSVLMIYNGSIWMQNMNLSLADIQKAAYSPEFTQDWNGLVSPSDMEKYIQNLQNQRIIVGTISSMPSSTSAQ